MAINLTKEPRVTCDVCAQRGVVAEAVVDRKTSMGPWAHMCGVCDAAYGVGRGTALAPIWV